MKRTTCGTLCLLLAALPAGAAVAPQGEGQPPTLAELVKTLRERQKESTSVEMEMTSTGRFAGGTAFEIKGTIRVLGTTHVHIENRAVFDNGQVVSEHETVKTPQGVWIREQDPAFGPTYLRMEPELVERLEWASEVLGKEGDVPGDLGNKAKDPLGAEMLESLDQHYDLSVTASRQEGEECWLIQGDRRAGVGGDEQPPAGLAEEGQPDRVELQVRQSDLVIRQMTLWADGREVARVSIDRLALNAPMEVESFRIELPPGKSFIPVMDHLPARTHIQYELKAAEAAAARAAEQAEGGASGEGGQGNGG